MDTPTGLEGYEMSPAEREEQRRSFAHGNVALHNPEVTREVIDRAAESMGYMPTGEPQPQIPGVTFFVYKRDGSMEISTDPYRRDFVSYQDFTVAEARITELEIALNWMIPYITPLAMQKQARAALAGTPRGAHE